MQHPRHTGAESGSGVDIFLTLLAPGVPVSSRWPVVTLLVPGDDFIEKEFSSVVRDVRPGDA